MLNKGFVRGKPFVVLGDFWLPVLHRVREVEFNDGSPWSEAKQRLVHQVPSPEEAAAHLAAVLAGQSQAPDSQQEVARGADRAPR
jgi:hypothetical protein